MTFKVLKTYKDDEVSTLKLIQLSEPKNFRVVGERLFGDTEYVIYGATGVQLEDDEWFEETTITACDHSGEPLKENGKEYQAFLYYALRKMTVEEAMFAIGELEQKEGTDDGTQKG